jgi:putative peptide zinc metalloprotease protein
MTAPSCQHKAPGKGMPIKVRQDIQVERQIYDGDPYYVVKDPITLKYFRMKEIEYFIFTLLDGARNVQDIQAEIEQHFSGLKVSEDQIKEFIMSVRSLNFLEDFGPGANKLLFQRSGFKRKARIKQTLMSFLFFKIPLVDPDRFLKKMHPYVKFIWTKPFLYAYLAFLFLALSILVTHTTEFIHQIQGFLTPKNLVLLAIAVMVTKTFHELGHGFTCRNYGGEVHELGILFIVFTPWMYCNVSDAWIFQKGRQRFIVSMAGILTELLVASIATIIWWWTPPGLLNSLCHNIIIICSIDNLFRNGNPLLRYDGYYALSDYLEIPNLRMKARAYLTYLMKRYLLRMEIEFDEEISSRRKKTYVIYGILSVIYRTFILLAIITLVGRRFFIIGLIMGAFLVYSSFIRPVQMAVAFIAKNRREMQFGRVAVSILAVIPLLAAGALFAYQPHLTVSSDCSVEPARNIVVRTEVEGYLEKILCNPGDRVRKGQAIAVFNNPPLSLQYEALKIDRAIVEKTMAKSLGSDKINEYDQYQIHMERLNKELAELEYKLSRMKVTADGDGIMLTDKLEERLGDYFRKGEFLCELGYMDEVIIRLIIPEAEMADAKVGQDMALKCHAYPEKTLHGKVTEISPVRIQTLENRALSSRFGGKFPTMPNMEKGGEAPVLPYFQVTMRIDNSDGLLKPGMTGVSKIWAEKKSLASILWHKILRSTKPELIL